MQQVIEFKISLPLMTSVKHIKEKSCYDNNYYQLEPYGEWIDFGNENNNILYIKYNECSNCYSYYFGRFDANGIFKCGLGYTTDYDILENINIE